MFVLENDRLVVRRIRKSKNLIHLSFDDGPCTEFTPLVLDVLKKFRAEGTFFVIGEKARQAPALLERMNAEGHSVFSHSIDHNYFHYFERETSLKNWLEDSVKDLSKITRETHSVFRPPAGVVTPPLLRACRKLQMPLVLWNQRFYDTVLTWSSAKAIAGAAKVAEGDIVLLHDVQPLKRREGFLKSLEIFLNEIQKRGLNSSALSIEQIRGEVYS